MGQFVAHKNLPILLVCCEKNSSIYLRKWEFMGRFIVLLSFV